MGEPWYKIAVCVREHVSLRCSLENFLFKNDTNKKEFSVSPELFIWFSITKFYYVKITEFYTL